MNSKFLCILGLLRVAEDETVLKSKINGFLKFKTVLKKLNELNENELGLLNEKYLNF